MTVLYRYNEQTSIFGETYIRLDWYDVVKETPQGYWIEVAGRRRWMSKTSRSAWAKPTPAEALQSFQARKRRQIAILEAQLHRAKDARNIALYDENMAAGKDSGTYTERGLRMLELRRWHGPDKWPQSLPLSVTREWADD